MEHAYIAIDLKSFYASQECVERGLDPLGTNLVVADPSRTEKTICLAVSPSLKKLGIPGRPRLFEVVEKVRQINALRRERAPGRKFTGRSSEEAALARDPSLELDFIVAPPQMARYVACSARIYQLYLDYVAPEDIHVYSIDEVFIDATHYLRTYGLTAEAFARKLVERVLQTTGITATAGIGTNLYLAKVAMDIVAKRMAPDRHGVRLAQLDEKSYRELLWDHQPLTDFWRVGPGYARKLERNGLRTMGDVARCSLGGPGEYYNEELLYRLFGVSAELLIDHAWGWEPCTIAAIKAYRPETNSICSGQVLSQPYSFEKARLIVKEMADLLALDLVEKGLVTGQLVLTIGYDRASLSDPAVRAGGALTTDRYGRQIPQHGHGSVNLPRPTASAKVILEAVAGLYAQVADPRLLVRRINLSANRVAPEGEPQELPEQLDLFTEPAAALARREAEEAALAREKRRQQAILSIRKKYGKNAILKGMNLEEGATTVARNGQIGGHKA